MRNIVNIIKFNLKAQKTLFIIEVSIILFLTLMGLKTWFFDIGIGKGVTSILPAVSVMIVVNFIIAIVKFSLQISNDEGRIIQLVPVKGWEFLIAKYIEFVIIQIGLVILGILACFILRGGSTIVFISSVSETFGLLIAYMMITAFIIISASYFEKTGVCVLTTILGCLIYNLALFILQVIITIFIPSIDLVINDFIRVGVIDTILSVGCFGGLMALSVYHFDKKLDIV